MLFLQHTRLSRTLAAAFPHGINSTESAAMDSSNNEPRTESCQRPASHSKRGFLDSSELPSNASAKSSSPKTRVQSPRLLQELTCVGHFNARATLHGSKLTHCSLAVRQVEDFPSVLTTIQNVARNGLDKHASRHDPTKNRGSL